MLIICGGCRKKLNVEDTLAGELGRCPSCNSVIKIPPSDAAASVGTDEPPPVAVVTPDPEIELQSQAAQGQAGADGLAGTGAPSDTAPQPIGSEGIRTDEQGFVLAVPVEDQDELGVPEPPTSIPGQGISIPRPGDSGDGGAYDLAGEDEPPAPAPESVERPQAGVGGLTAGLDEILDRLDAQQDQAGPAGAQAPSTEKIITRCPGCGARLAIEAQYAGGMRTCPKCATEIQVPLESTVIPPHAAVPGAPTARGVSQAVPSSLAEDLSPDVDLDSYIAEPEIGRARVVASYWLVVVFLVGLTIGFAVGWLLAGSSSRTGPSAPEPSPPAEVEEGA